MFPSRSQRIGAAIVLIAVLAAAQAAPARAAGWSENWDWADVLGPRVLAWLGFAQEPSASKDCAHIDPNGHCIKSEPRGQRTASPIRDRAARSRMTPSIPAPGGLP